VDVNLGRRQRITEAQRSAIIAMAHSEQPGGWRATEPGSCRLPMSVRRQPDPAVSSCDPF